MTENENLKETGKRQLREVKHNKGWEDVSEGNGRSEVHPQAPHNGRKNRLAQVAFHMPPSVPKDRQCKLTEIGKLLKAGEPGIPKPSRREKNLTEPRNAKDREFCGTMK